MDKRFMILSLKRTHKNDPWLTLWRTNSSGYCWFKEWAGLYDSKSAHKNLDEENEKIIDTNFVNEFWEEIVYNGEKRLVLPNTNEVLEAIGIDKHHLLKKYPS